MKESCPFCGAEHEAGTLMPALLEKKRVDVTGLEPDAVRVVERVVERMRIGQVRYGLLDIATNPRDARAWENEALEEELDNVIYRTIGQLARAQGR